MLWEAPAGVKGMQWLTGAPTCNAYSGGPQVLASSPSTQVANAVTSCKGLVAQLLWVAQGKHCYNCKLCANATEFCPLSRHTQLQGLSTGKGFKKANPECTCEVAHSTNKGLGSQSDIYACLKQHTA